LYLHLNGIKAPRVAGASKLEDTLVKIKKEIIMTSPVNTFKRMFRKLEQKADEIHELFY
jgi:hypothetical protein